MTYVTIAQARRAQAADTLAYYFRTLFEKAGFKWNTDNEAAMRHIVDDIVQAAIEP